MAERKPPKLRLVAVEALPERAHTGRKSVYHDLVNEFAGSDLKFARVEGAKTTSVVTIKKAIVATGHGDTVEVVTRNKELYLTKK